MQGLDHFTVQIISREAGPVGAVRKLKVWKAARTHASVALLKLNRVDFEEGWHHVRVLPWTADGDPIPLDEPDDQTAKRTNESEPFYVLPGAALEEEPPQRAVPKADSVEHARLDRQFAAVTQDRDPTDIAPAQHRLDPAEHRPGGPPRKRLSKRSSARKERCRFRLPVG